MLIRARVGMLAWFVCQQRNRTKFTTIQISGAGARSTGAGGHFPRSRSWSRNHRDSKLGAGAGARDGMIPWSWSRSRSKPFGLCILASVHTVPSLRLRVLLAIRHPPDCPMASWLKTCGVLTSKFSNRLMNIAFIVSKHSQRFTSPIPTSSVNNI